MRGILFALTPVAIFVALLLPTQGSPKAQGLEPGSLVGPGKLILPLKHTSVYADVSGFGARVTVTQTFINPSPKPIEAIYTFPLPADAAVDRMLMKIGDRVIQGKIKRRDEAKQIYEAAKSQGKAAALLDQQRPNIFTQSVANILPGSQIQIEISYVQILKFEEDQFEFTFPMVVGPRYVGNAPDAEKISPPVVPLGTRSGHNVDLTVRVDAGAPVQELKSVLHQVSTVPLPANAGPGRFVVKLRDKDEIPNRDFILRYRTATSTVSTALLANYDPLEGGHFALVLMPPKTPTAQQIAPKEMIFVMDQSGSQDGFPIDKSKELTLKLIDHLNPGDTFNVMGFSSQNNLLWKQPRPNTRANREDAKMFVRSLHADGGTELERAISAVCSAPDDPNRLRIVVFNTDGFAGDEKAILGTIQHERRDTRIFTFGIGNEVNRYLIDSMSEVGRGDSEVVTLAESADPAVDRFLQRTQNPVLTDVSVAFAGVEVTDQIPNSVPDVFSEKPIVIYGKYTAPGPGTVTISGRVGGKPWSRRVEVFFPSDRPGGESVPTLWARQRIHHLELKGANQYLTSEDRGAIENAVIDLALRYRIMSSFTSFVAVEEKIVNAGGKQQTVEVPVERGSGLSDSLYKRLGPDGGTSGGGTNTGSTTGGTTGSITAMPAVVATHGVANLSYDPSDNSYINKRVAKGKLTPAMHKAAAKAEWLGNLGKISESLARRKGSFKVQITVTDVKPATIKKLRAAGLAITHTEGRYSFVLGSCDRKAAERLAQMREVILIERGI